MKRLLAAVAVLLVTTVAALAGLEAHYRGLEAGLRLTIAPPDEPGRKFVLTGKNLNSQGFRERELELEKHDRVYRIIVLGDSVSFGGGVRIHEAWPRVAEGFIAERRRVQVVNLSVFSYDIEQIIATLRHRGHAWEPDLVVYGAYINDHVPTDLLQTTTGPIYVGSTLAPGLHGPGWLVPHSALLRRYYGGRATRLEGTLREAEWKGDVSWYAQQLEELRAEAGDKLFVFSLLPHDRSFQEMHERYNALYEELGIPYASALPYLVGSGRESFFSEDSPEDIVHPDATGQRLYGWAFADAFERLEAGGAMLRADEVAEVPAAVMEVPDVPAADGVPRPGTGKRKRQP